MNEQLIWILAAALAAVVVVALLWLGRRRQQRARDAAAQREAQRVALEQAEHVARAQRLANGLDERAEQDPVLREIEDGLALRLAEQRAQADALEAQRDHSDREEAAQRDARAQATREAHAAAEARRLSEQREAAEREEAERLARQEAAAREAARQAEEAEAARRAAEAERIAREQAERQAAAEAEAARLAAETEAREQAEREAAELAEAERLAREQADREAAARAAQAAEAARLAAEAAARAQPVTTRELRTDETLIVVADDSKIVRVKLSRLLTAQGYRVALAESGEQALALMAAERPHVLITDVEMPGIDGFELTRQVRATPATAALPVLMITSSDDKHEAAAAAGVTQLLGKPFSEEALLGGIERARLAVRVPV